MNGAQITLGIIFAISLLLHARDHGKPKTGKDSFWAAALSFLIINTVLYWGGFWSIAQ